jgi:hypothetical protein
MGLTGAGSRSKGQRGEREVFALLSEALGFVVRRKAVNRRGDPDGVDVPGWAIEVKRVEQSALRAWWRQTEAQADLIGRKPILFFRASRQPWQAMIDLSELNPVFVAGRFQVCLPFDAACQLMREALTKDVRGHQECSIQ